MLHWMAARAGRGHEVLGAASLEMRPGPYGVFHVSVGEEGDRIVACALVSPTHDGGTLEDWFLFEGFSSPRRDSDGRTTHALRTEAIRPGALHADLEVYDDPGIVIPRSAFLAAMNARAKETNQVYTHLVARVCNEGQIP